MNRELIGLFERFLQQSQNITVSQVCSLSSLSSVVDRTLQLLGRKVHGCCYDSPSSFFL
jgi:hypothetical protein